MDNILNFSKKTHVTKPIQEIYLFFRVSLSNL